MLDSILESSLVIDLYYSLYDFARKFNIFFIYNPFIFFIDSICFLQIVYFFSFYLFVSSISILFDRICTKKPQYCFPTNNTAAFLCIFPNLRLSPKNLSFGEGMWESNPPRTLLTPHTGFEDQETHQLSIYPHILIISIKLIHYIKLPLTFQVFSYIIFLKKTELHTRLRSGLSTKEEYLKWKSIQN